MTLKRTGADCGGDGGKAHTQEGHAPALRSLEKSMSLAHVVQSTNALETNSHMN